MNKPKIAIVVHACDKYQLLFRGFIYFFKKNWPLELPDVSFYFLTEDIEIGDNLFTTIKTGSNEWSERLRIGLNHIEAEYIVYFQEDMWLKTSIHTDTLKKLLSYIVSENINLLKLHDSDFYFSKTIETKIYELPLVVLDNAKCKFLMSHQISIWNKDFLLKQLTFFENPWQHELTGTERLKKMNSTIHQICLIKGNETIKENTQPFFNQSEYKSISVNSFLDDSVLPYIEQMMHTNEVDIVSYAKTLNYHYDNHLTHDGKSIPQPNPIIKRVKQIAKFILGKS